MIHLLQEVNKMYIISSKIFVVDFFELLKKFMDRDRKNRQRKRITRLRFILLTESFFVDST